MCLLIGIALLFAQPASPAPLAAEAQTALAEVQKHLANRPTMEVVYQFQSKSPADSKLKLPPRSGEALEVTWLRKGAMEFCSVSYTTEPKTTISKWAYDGTTTHEWNYYPESGKLADVYISNGPPRIVLSWKNPLTHALGLELFDVEGTPASFIAAAIQGKTVTQTGANDGVVAFTLGSHTVNRALRDVDLSVDLPHGSHLRTLGLKHFTKGKLLSEWRVTVDEFQQVPDLSTGGMTWFPLRAHMLSGKQVTTMDVVSVQINGLVPDSRFAHEEPPFGTRMREESNPPGGRERSWLVGGEAAHKKQLEEINEARRMQIARLEKDGVTHHARAVSHGASSYWMLSSVVLLVLAGARWRSQRAR